MIPNVDDYMVLQFFKLQKKAGRKVIDVALVCGSDLCRYTYWNKYDDQGFLSLSFSKGGYETDPTVTEIIGDMIRKEFDDDALSKSNPVMQALLKAVAIDGGRVKRDIGGKPYIKRMNEETETVSIFCDRREAEFSVGYEHSLSHDSALTVNLWPIEEYRPSAKYPLEQLIGVNYAQRSMDIVEKCERLIGYVNGNLLDRKS